MTPSSDPVTSQRPHSRTASHWELGFNKCISGRHKHSVSSAGTSSCCFEIYHPQRAHLYKPQVFQRLANLTEPVFFKTTMIRWSSIIPGALASLPSKAMFTELALSGSKATAWSLPEQWVKIWGVNFKSPQTPKVIDPIVTEKVKRKRYKWVYAHKLNNLNEMDLLLKSNKWLKVT